MVVSGILPGKSAEQVFCTIYKGFVFFDIHMFQFCGNTLFPQAELATLLGCLEAAYTTLEMRETSKEKAAGATGRLILNQCLFLEIS